MLNETMTEHDRVDRSDRVHRVCHMAFNVPVTRHYTGSHSLSAHYSVTSSKVSLRVICKASIYKLQWHPIQDGWLSALIKTLQGTMRTWPAHTMVLLHRVDQFIISRLMPTVTHTHTVAELESDRYYALLIIYYHMSTKLYRYCFQNDSLFVHGITNKVIRCHFANNIQQPLCFSKTNCQTTRHLVA